MTTSPPLGGWICWGCGRSVLEQKEIHKNSGTYDGVALDVANIIVAIFECKLILGLRYMVFDRKGSRSAADVAGVESPLYEFYETESGQGPQ